MQTDSDSMKYLQKFNNLSNNQKRWAIEFAWFDYVVKYYALRPFMAVTGFIAIILIFIAMSVKRDGMEFFLLSLFPSIATVFLYILHNKRMERLQILQRNLTELKQMGLAFLENAYPAVLETELQEYYNQITNLIGNVEAIEENSVVKGFPVLQSGLQHFSVHEDIFDSEITSSTMLLSPFGNFKVQRPLIANFSDTSHKDGDHNRFSGTLWSAPLFKESQIISPTFFLGSAQSVTIVPKLESNDLKGKNIFSEKFAQVFVAKQIKELLMKRPYINLYSIFVQKFEDNAEPKYLNMEKNSAIELFFSEMVNVEYDGDPNGFDLSISTRDGKTFDIDGNVEIANWLRDQIRASKPNIESNPPVRTVPTTTAISTPEVKNDTKTCPMCAEDIKAAAKICRYCRHTFDQP